MMTSKNYQTLRLFRRQSSVDDVLGPYKRAVIWTQGCNWGCQGCIVPESWSSDGGESVSINELSNWILAQKDIEGITISGGEPMLQAQALWELIKKVQQQRDLGVVCYTGYLRENLQKKGNQAQKRLLGAVDLLIDGLYQENLHDDLLWRGSKNQRLLLLTPRYRAYLQQRLRKSDSSAGLQFCTEIEGTLFFTGVPPQPNFRPQFQDSMRKKGILIEVRSQMKAIGNSEALEVRGQKSEVSE